MKSAQLPAQTEYTSGITRCNRRERHCNSAMRVAPVAIAALKFPHLPLRLKQLDTTADPHASIAHLTRGNTKKHLI